MGKHEAASRKRARALLGRAGYKSGGHVTPAEAVHDHEANMHPGKTPTRIPRKDGGRITGPAARQRLDRARRGKPAVARASGGRIHDGQSEAGELKQADRAELARVARARGGRTKHKGSGHQINVIIPQGGGGAGGDPAAAHAAGVQQGAMMARGAPPPRPPMAGGPPAGGLPPPGGMPPGTGAPMPPGAMAGGPPPGRPPMPPMRDGGRTPYKRGGRTKAALETAFREIKENPPKILAKTRAKKGRARAEKQRVAIGLSKGRAAGADIPKRADGGRVLKGRHAGAGNGLGRLEKIAEYGGR
ncbi:MAG: hypothetical protein ACREQ5_09215 [Candidatus Dormibacteria bacterium]